jgi:hypothetical protein
MLDLVPPSHPIWFIILAPQQFISSHRPTNPHFLCCRYTLVCQITAFLLTHQPHYSSLSTMTTLLARRSRMLQSAVIIWMRLIPPHPHLMLPVILGSVIIPSPTTHTNFGWLTLKCCQVFLTGWKPGRNGAVGLYDGVCHLELLCHAVPQQGSTQTQHQLSFRDGN